MVVWDVLRGNFLQTSLLLVINYAYKNVKQHQKRDLFDLK